GHRIGEGAPGEDVADMDGAEREIDGELDQEIGRGNHRDHGGNRRQETSKHQNAPLCERDPATDRGARFYWSTMLPQSQSSPSGQAEGDVRWGVRGGARTVSPKTNRAGITHAVEAFTEAGLTRRGRRGFPS